MNVLNRHPTTPDEFLRWNEGREGKWDFVEGRLAEMMVRVSKAHAMVAANLLALLKSRLPTPPYVVTAADFGVKTRTSVRYPDVLVDGSVGDPSDLAASHPLLVAEVLSPSTAPIDFGRKADEYRTIDGLSNYLVLAQDAARAWLWSRDESGAWQEPILLEGGEAVIKLRDLGIEFALGEVYAGLFGMTP